MKILIVAFCAMAILMSSCSRTEGPKPAGKQPATTQKGMVPYGKEDEDRPIRMQKVIGRSGLPLEHALVELTKGQTTLQQYTGNDGICQTILTEYGAWELRISADGYEDLTQQLVITDSLTISVDTLR